MPVEPSQTLVDGVKMHRLTVDEAAHFIAASASTGRGGTVVTPNVDHLRLLRRPEGEALRSVYRRASLVLADGQPVVWASWLQGDPLPGRAAGSDLWWQLSAEAGRRGLDVAVVGGGAGVAERAGAVIAELSPGPRVVYSDGPVVPPEPTREDMLEVAAQLKVSGARIVFLGLGCPKQEIAAGHLRELIPDVWLVCVGAAVDFAAGTRERAPRLLQVLGLEWAYRLAQEPRRLAGRYLLKDGPYALRLLSRSLAVRFRQPGGDPRPL